MKKSLKSLLVAVAAMWCCAVSAKDSAYDGDMQPWFPIGLSFIAPPMQFPSSSHSLFGAMVNLGYGRMSDLCILDVGIANNVTHNMVGLEVGVVDLAGRCVGGQVGVVNISDSLYGVQVGAGNITGYLHGLQLGVINFSSNGGALVFPILNIGF